MTRFTSTTVDLPDDSEAVSDYLYERGLSDGLPVIVPTVQRVERMLSGTRRDPASSLGPMPPSNAPATVEKVAINAVLAGCKPEQLPVLIAAVDAALDPAWKLDAVQPTTMALGPMVIVNGPVRSRADVNGGTGSLGPGWRGNATIGRALRLLLINLGGARPGDVDRATQGFPGKYSFCFAENEEESPWEPLHATRGFGAGESAVTVVAVSSSTNVSDSTDDAADLLRTITGGLTNPSTANVMDPLSTPVLALNALHATILARAGFGRVELQDYLFEHVRLPADALSARRAHLRRSAGEDLFLIDGRIPFTNDPRNILIVVTGGMGGNHSTYMQNGVYGHAISRRVDD